MAAPENISIFFKERAAASESINERLILKENAQVVFLCVCVAASRNISMFFDINKISMSDCF